MARRIIWLLLILQALSLASSDTRANAGRGRDTTVGQATTVPAVHNDIVAEKLDAKVAPEPGSDDVAAALSELRRIRTSSFSRRRKSSGFLGTLWYLVMKAAPSLRLSAPPPESSSRSSSSGRAVTGPLQRALSHLEHAASTYNNSDAHFLLAELSFFGNYSCPRNFSAAFHHYSRLAELTGNATALHMVGLMYSTGVGGAVPRDQARALLYYTFAATAGYTKAEMTVAARHHQGIGTPKSCDRAVRYYKRVADKAIAWYRAGPPGGTQWTHEAHRLADEVGGVYGEGASASSSGMNAIRASVHSDQYSSIEDVIEYLDLMSSKGDFKASFNLGRIFYEGQRGLDRDFGLAMRYFLSVVKLYWKGGSGRVTDHPKPELAKTAGRAAGYIGRMFLRGDGVDRDPVKARKWFERGIQTTDPQSQWGLGYMLLHGIGVPRNVARATELFTAASDQEYAPAQVELGVLYLDQGQPDDLKVAYNYFELAARFGNMDALYYLGELTNLGVGRDRSCNMALHFYKSVAEKAEPLVSSWAEANQAYEDGDYDLALLGYLMAAEQGYERAQNNVAFMLDPPYARSALPRWFHELKTAIWPSTTSSAAPSSSSSAAAASRPTSLLDDQELALIHWTRSSRQSNIDSLVKMGDYYLYGIGTERDVDKAAQCYAGASEYHQSAQALFNLGWMHENGVGLTQDFHLAKRYYDQALETNDEAYLPVTLSLLKLRIRSAWNTFTHGRVNSIRDEPETKKEWSLSEWIANFLHDDPNDPYYQHHGAPDQDALNHLDDQQLYDDGAPGGDGNTGAGTNAAQRALEEDFEDAVFDTLVLGTMALMLVLLVLYRQNRVQAHRRRQQAAADQEGAGPAGPQPQMQRANGNAPNGEGAGAGGASEGIANAQRSDAMRRQTPSAAQQHGDNEQQRQQQEEDDRGMFPPDGDAEVPAWLAGGVGH